MVKDEKLVEEMFCNLMQKVNAEIEDLDELTLPEFKDLSDYEQGLCMGRYNAVNNVLEQIKRLAMELELFSDHNTQNVF